MEREELDRHTNEYAITVSDVCLDRKKRTRKTIRNGWKSKIRWGEGRDDISANLAFKLGSERWVESSQEMSEENHVQRSQNGNKLVKGIRNWSV